MNLNLIGFKCILIIGLMKMSWSMDLQCEKCSYTHTHSHRIIPLAFFLFFFCFCTAGIWNFQLFSHVLNAASDLLSSQGVLLHHTLTGLLFIPPSSSSRCLSCYRSSSVSTALRPKSAGFRSDPRTVTKKRKKWLRTKSLKLVSVQGGKATYPHAAFLF